MAALIRGQATETTTYRRIGPERLNFGSREVDVVLVGCFRDVSTRGMMIKPRMSKININSSCKPENIMLSVMSQLGR